MESVISARDVDNIYKVPLGFHAEGVDDTVLDHFGIEAPAPDLDDWQKLVRSAQDAATTPPVRIALVGKYVQLEDAYLSVVEALRHSGFQHGCGVEIDWVDSETLDDAEVRARLEEADGILIPGGFGERGIEGKIAASRIARELKIPFLGVCLGMQMAVADFARHVVGMDGANSTEFDPETPYPVIDLLPEQKEINDMGGTMRLGADPIKLHEGTQGARDLRRGRHLRAPPPPLRGQQLPAQAARERRPGRLGHVAGRAPGRDHRAAATTRTSSPRSTTRSSSRARSGPRRCSASSSGARARAQARARERARPRRAERAPATTARCEPRRAASAATQRCARA